MENHHVAASFELMTDEDLNFLINFSKDDYKKVREIMIHMILATDMTKHFSDLAKFKSRLASEDFKPD